MQQDELLFQVLKGTALSVLVLWTIAANTLVFVVLYKNPRLQTVPNLLVGNLAFSDLCLGLIVLPLSSIYAIAGEWLFPETLCIIFVSADILCSTASIWNLSIVGLDRYWAITTPVAYMSKRNKRTAGVMILSVWISSMLISLAPLLGWKQVAEHGNLVQINGTWQCTFLDLPSYTIYSATGSFFIPTIVMFFVYFKIYQAFAKHRARQIYRQKVIRKHIESTILHEISHVLPTSDEFAKDNDEEEEDSDENNGKRRQLDDDDGEDVENNVDSEFDSDSSCLSSSSLYSSFPTKDMSTLSVAPDLVRPQRSKSDCGQPTIFYDQNEGGGEKSADPEERNDENRKKSLKRRDSSSRKRRKSRKSEDGGALESSFNVPTANGSASANEVTTSSSVIVRRQTSPPEQIALESETTISILSDSTSRPSSIVPSGEVDVPCANVTLGAAQPYTSNLRFPIGRIASTPVKGAGSYGGGGTRYHNPQYYHTHHVRLPNRHGDSEHVPAAITYEKIKRHKRRKERAYRRSLQRKPKAISAAKERRGVKVLGIILGCFTICWTPFFVMYVLAQFCAQCAMNKHIEMFITWLGYSNSAMNPIIYTVFNRDYQIALKRLFTSEGAKISTLSTDKNINIKVNQLAGDNSGARNKRELLMAASRAISSPPYSGPPRGASPPPSAVLGALASIRRH